MASETAEVETSETDTEQVEESAATADETETESLGEPGLRALKAEREARKAAEAQAKTLADGLAELRASGEATAGKIAELEQALQASKAAAALHQRAAETGIPAEILAGPGEDADAYIAALTAWKETNPTVTPGRVVGLGVSSGEVSDPNAWLRSLANRN